MTNLLEACPTIHAMWIAYRDSLGLELLDDYAAEMVFAEGMIRYALSDVRTMATINYEVIALSRSLAAGKGLKKEGGGE